jgi:hypothetical protein
MPTNSGEGYKRGDGDCWDAFVELVGSQNDRDEDGWLKLGPYGFEEDYEGWQDPSEVEHPPSDRHEGDPSSNDAPPEGSPPPPEA